MKEELKKILKKIISNKFLKKYQRSIYLRNKYNQTTIKEKIKCLLLTNNIKIYNFVNFSKLLIKTKKKINFTDHFCYFVDFNSLILSKGQLNSNMSPNYQIILEHSLEDFKRIYKNNNEQLQFIQELENYLDIYIQKIKDSNSSCKDRVIYYLNSIKNKSCNSFIEAIQRILFFNQIFWQIGYNLCGLGRLDFILLPYYDKDIKNHKINKKEVRKILEEFYYLLHIDYKHKSNCLQGDTGQIIVLGGLNKEGKLFSSDLTLSFMDALENFRKPDPKLFLRVTKDTDKKLMMKAFKLISLGIGSPVISNDDVIIPKLIAFGYKANHAWNYIPAACWEPSVCGHSIDLNNAGILNILEPLQEIIDENKTIKTEYLLSNYLLKLRSYIRQKVLSVQKIEYDKQPYMSLFIQECLDNHSCITGDVVFYKNIGFTTVGLSSVVNSLLNIKRIVEEKKVYSFLEFNCFRKKDFINEKALAVINYHNQFGYGSNDVDAIKLTNIIINCISDELKKYKTQNGGNFKFGLSAPSYVEVGKTMAASFDGRKKGQPLGIHISSNHNSYIDVMDFAAKISYPENCINGNLVDFIISPFYIKNNIDKFMESIEYYLHKGVNQLQINVIDSKTLIAAKKNPDLYKNLIVRVWGFSAYFNDLPEAYKDLMIERVLQSERTIGGHE